MRTGLAEQGARQLVERRRQPLGQHLLVAVDAQLPRQPLEFVADRVGDGPVQDLSVRAEAAAQPTGGDAHPVHGVVYVAPYGGVEFDERVTLGAYVREDVVASGGRLGLRDHDDLGLLLLTTGRLGLLGQLDRPGLSRLRLLPVLRLSPGLRQRPGQFGGGLGAADPGLAELLLDLVEEGGVAVVGQLHLDLGPLGGPVAAAEPLGVYAVDADLGEQAAGGVDEVADVARGLQSYDGEQFGVAYPGADESGEAPGQCVGQRGADLVAYAVGDRQLQMPARVIASGTAAQRDRGRGEPLVGRVVVGRVEIGDALVDDAVDAAHTAQIGKPRTLARLILALDFPLCVRHGLNLVTIRHRGQPSKGTRSPSETHLTFFRTLLGACLSNSPADAIPAEPPLLRRHGALDPDRLQQPDSHPHREHRRPSV